MKVIVDTDVWSGVMREPKSEPSKQVLFLKVLIHDGRVQMIGPIRQEVPSGLRESECFIRFREVLRAFPGQDIKIGILNKRRRTRICTAVTVFKVQS
jgi:hypothetical protein